MKKSLKFTSLLALFFCIVLDVNCQDRWWQREIPAPSTNQIINPNYLAKKRELEKTLDNMNDLARQRNNYARAGQTDAVKSADEMLQFMGKKMNTLEYELSKIPMYVTNPNYNQNNNTQTTNQKNTEVYISTSSNPSTNSSSSNNDYLLVLYQIKNCNRDSYKNDYDFNEASLRLFNSLKDNINKIVRSEKPNLSYGIDYTKEKITYYNVFIDNWKSSVGTQEAQKEIDNLNKYIVEESNRLKEIAIRNNTDLIIKYKIIGNFPPEKEVKKHQGWTYYYKYYNYHLWFGAPNHDISFKNGEKKEYAYSFQNFKYFDPIDFYNEEKYKNLKFRYYTYFDEPSNTGHICDKEFSLEVPYTLGKRTILNLYIYLENTYVKEVRYDVEQVAEIPNGLKFDN